MLIEILVILALIVLNGVLSMSEMAIVSARPARLKSLDGKSKGAAAALRLAENPGRFLSTVQIGITMVGVLSGALSGATLGAYCNSESRSARFPDAEACKLAVYAGKTWSYRVNGQLTVSTTAGFIGGYERGIMPMVLPSALIGNHLRVVIIPAVDPKVRTWAVHAAYEF